MPEKPPSQPPQPPKQEVIFVTPELEDEEEKPDEFGWTKERLSAVNKLYKETYSLANDQYFVNWSNIIQRMYPEINTREAGDRAFGDFLEASKLLKEGRVPRMSADKLETIYREGVKSLKEQIARRQP